jgi:hypothetical protein
MTTQDVGGGAARLQPPTPKAEFKKHGFCIQNDIKVLHDLCLSLNQPQKLADDQYAAVLKNRIKTCKYVDFFFFSFNFLP